MVEFTLSEKLQLQRVILSKRSKNEFVGTKSKREKQTKIGVTKQWGKKKNYRGM